MPELIGAFLNASDCPDAKADRGGLGSVCRAPDTNLAANCVSPHRQTVLWALVLVLLLGAFLRFYRLGQRPLWSDELWTASGVAQPTMAAMVAHFSPRNPLPMSLAFLAARFSVSFGQDPPGRDLWLRLPTTLAGVLGIALTYALGQRLLARREAAYAAFLLSISAFHVRLSQVARYYGIFMALGTLAMVLFWKARATHRWFWWVAFTLVSIAGAYTHLFAAFVPLTCALFALTVSVWRVLSAARRKKAAFVFRREVRSLIPLALSGLVIVAACAPNVPRVMSFWASQSGAGAGQQLNLMQLAGLAAEAVFDFGYGSWMLTSLLLCFSLLGLWSTARRQRQVACFALLVFVVPLVSIWAVRSRHSFGGKYVIFMLPLLFLLVAEGITSFSQAMAHALSGQKGAPGSRTEVRVTGIVLLCLLAVNLLFVCRWFSLRLEDWRGAAAFLEERVQPGDLIVCDGQFVGAGGDHGRASTGLGLYLDAQTLQVRLVRERLAVDWVLQAGDRQQRVWGVLWHSQPLTWVPGESVLVEQFEQVTVVRTATTEPQSAREELRHILLALYDMQPRREARTDLLLGLQELVGCDLSRRVAQPSSQEAAQEVEAALEACTSALGAGPEEGVSAQDHYDRGQELALAGEWAAASVEYAQAASLAPQHGAYRLAYGWALFRAGAPADVAREQLNQAAEADAQNPWPHVYLAEIALAEGDPDLALRSAGQAIARNPNLFSGWVLQGQALERLGRLSEAEESLRQAMELAPERPAPHEHLGDVLAQQGRWSEAVGAYERAAALAPDNVRHWLNLAGAYQAIGNRSRAVSAYERVLELEPGNSEADRALQDLSP